MSTEIERAAGTIGPAVIPPEEVPMVRQERWEEVRRLWQQERVPIAELARRFELDRKTVRRCLRETAWQPYQRPAPAETLLTTHAEYLQARAPKVPLLRPDPLPGAAAAGLPGQLRDREAVRPAPADGAAARRGDGDALRDPAGGPEPDRLGDGHGALSASSPGCCTSSCSPWV
jgi:hypothetical protein